MVRINRAIATVRSSQGERTLSKDASGVWSLTLPAVEPDIYEYHFKVDDFEMLDPRNLVVKYNSRPNLSESLLEVPDSTPMFYDVRPVAHGKIDIRMYDSKTTGGTRRILSTHRPVRQIDGQAAGALSAARRRRRRNRLDEFRPHESDSR